MDFFASDPFLTSLAEDFHHAKEFRIAIYEIGGRVVRLAEIAGGQILVTGPFYDYVKPLQGDNGTSRGVVKFVPKVVTATVALDEHHANKYESGAGQDPAPLIVWGGFPTWEAYLEFVRKRNKDVLRVTQRRRAKLLTDYSSPTYLFDDRNAEALEALCTWKKAQYKGGHETLENPRALAMLRHLFGDGHLIVSTLMLNGRYLAIQAGFLWDGEYLALIPAYDPAFAKYGVGKELLLRMLEDSYRQGHKSFDFLQGAEPYKFDFATHVQIIESLGTPSLALRFRTRVQSGAKAALVRLSPRLFYKVKRMMLGTRRVGYSLKQSNGREVR